ncbi:hypothetical protein AMECASPLE_018713 [Ameca splendens]|uniref:KASH domain-containing protein n=1 Tax=Ameca splendens TaxID=208324 RepID=A0ABV0ZQB0_9TELE
MSSKTEGDSKLQKLRRHCQSFCTQDLGEQKKQDIQQRLRDSEEQWTKLLKHTKQAMSEAERQHALDLQLRNYEALKESTSSWLERRQQALTSLDHETDPEQVIKTVQNILSLKPEADSKLTELTRQSQNLSEQEEISEHTRREAQKAAQDSEQLWGIVLQTAENTLLRAEVQYLLSREMEAFHNHAGSTKNWIEDLQKQADSMQCGTQGSKAQLQERMNTAQAILSSKSNGESQVIELKTRAQSLCEHTDLEADKKVEVQQIVQDVETRWRTVVRAAEETQRQLHGVMERLLSCEYKQDKAEARLAEIQKQTSNLPQIFPWPGLGERRQAVEQARTLLDQSTTLAPLLSDVRSQREELYEITQDQSWTNPSWKARDDAIPALLTQLTDVVANLEQGIVKERQCTLLIEQHEAAQDWLREQVKGLGPPPADRHGLRNAVNTLKALLQTVDREQREMMELEAAKDCLLSLCTPGGQDAITLEVSHLHELCANSEQEVRERLTTCKRRLEEMDCELAQISQGLKERAAALQWELRSLDQAFSYSEPQNNIAQLQQHWHSLQNCENSLLDLGVKVHDMYQEVNSATFTNELPAEIISLVASLCQQHASLECRLSDHQGACSTNTAHYLKDCISAMQQWSQSNPSDSASSVQLTLEEGTKLQHNLHEALSHQQFLTACLTMDLFEKFKKECLGTLRQVDVHKTSLSQILKEIEERDKRLPDAQSSDVSYVNLVETKTTVVAPPRKSKHSYEKQSVSLAEKCTSIKDELSSLTDVHATEMQTEAQTPEPSLRPVMEVSKSAIYEETSPLPSRRKSKSLDIKKEPVHTKVGSELKKAPTPVCSDITSSEPKTKFEPISNEDRSPIILSKTTDSKSKQNQENVENAPSVATTIGEYTDVCDPQLVQGYTDLSLLGQRELLPPRRKPKSPKCPPKYLGQQIAQKEPTEVSHGEESKLIPVRRKSKTAIPPATSLQSAFDSRGTEFEAEDKKTATPTSETTDVKKGKPSPTKRRSRGQIILMEHTAKTLAESQPEPNSDKSSEEQLQVFVEETALMPSWQKSENLEVPIAPELIYPPKGIPSVDSEDTQQESVKYVATETVTVKNESTYLPQKRKSKKTDICLVQALQTREEPEGHKSFQFEQNNIKCVAQEASTSDEIKGSTEPSLVEKCKPSPTKRMSGSLKPLQDPIAKPVLDTLEEQKSSEGTETIILTETEPMPIVRTSASRDVSAAVQPATVGTSSLEFNETEKELESGRTTDQEVHELFPTTRSKSLVICQEHLNQKKIQGMESGQITEGAAVLQTQLPGSDSLPLPGPQMAMATTETLVVEVVSLLCESTDAPKSQSLKEQLHIPEITSANHEPKNLTEYEEGLVAQVDERHANIVVDVNLVGTEPRQRRKDLTRAEPSEGPESLFDAETHTGVVTKHPTEDHDSVQPTTAMKMTENDSVDNQIVAEDISPEDEKVFQDQDQQEKGVAIVVLDISGRFMPAVDSHSNEVEIRALAHANDSEVDISASSIILNKTSDTELQKTEHKTTEASQQTVFQSSERDLDTVSELQLPLSSDSTDVSRSLQPETMDVGTGGLEIKETGNKLDTARVFSTQQSDTLTSDQEEYEFFTKTSTKSPIVSPEPSYKEKIMGMKVSDSQQSEADDELTYFTEQQGLTASVINEQSPDKIELNYLIKCDEAETESQSEEATLSTQEDKGHLATAVVEQTSLTNQESESLEDFDGIKASTDREVLTAQTEKDNANNQTVVEQSSEVGDKTEIQIFEDHALKEKKMDTIIIDTSEGFIDEANFLPDEVEMCALSSQAKELISASSVMPYQESEHRPKDAPQQTVTQSSERDLDTASKVQFSSSSDPTDAPNLADYIENLWKNTDEIEKRYLILDVPDRAICQTFDIDLKQPDKESEGKNDSNRFCSSVCAIAMSQEGRAGLTEINFSEDENVKLRGTGSEQEESEHGTSQEKSKELEESDVHGVKQIREERSAQREPSCILPLDIATTPEVTDNTCVTGNGPNKEPAEANIQEGITKQISSEAKPSASELVLDHKTEFVEINFYEQDQIHQIETKMANKYSIPDEHSTLLTHMGDPKFVTLEKSPMLTDVCELDIQRGPEDSETTSIQEEKEILIDIVQTHNQSEKNLADIIPDEAATEMNEIKMQESGTQILGNVAQSDSVQLSFLGYESIQPHETRVIEISLKNIGPREHETRMELLKTEQERPGLDEEHSDMKDHPEMSAETPDAFSKSLGEQSEEGQKTLMEPEEQVATQSSATEHKNMFAKVEEPAIDTTGADSQQTDSMWKEIVSQSDSNQHILSTLPSYDSDTVLEDRIATEEDHLIPQAAIRQDISKIIQERPGDLPKNLNEKAVSEKGTQLLILQPDIQVQQITSSVIIAEVPQTDSNETSIQGQIVTEQQEPLSLDIYPFTMLEVTVKQQGQQESVEAGPSEKGCKERRQDDTLESYKCTLSEVEKDPSVTDQPSKPSIRDTNVAPETFYKTFVENREILVNPFEVQTVDTEKQPGMEPSMKSDTVKESQDSTVAKVQPDGSAVGWNKEAVKETIATFLSESSLVHMVRTDKHSTDAKEKIDGQVRETEERTVSAELPLETTADEVKLQNVNLPKVCHSNMLIRMV